MPSNASNLDARQFRLLPNLNITRSEEYSELLSSTDGGVNMIPGRLSHRREFTPVPSLSSVFVYMISPIKAMLGRLNTAQVHPGCCTGAKISFRREISQWYHVKEERPLVPVWNRPPGGLERVAHAFFFLKDNIFAIWIHACILSISDVPSGKHDTNSPRHDVNAVSRSHPGVKLAPVRVFSCKHPLKRTRCIYPNFKITLNPNTYPIFGKKVANALIYKGTLSVGFLGKCVSRRPHCKLAHISHLTGVGVYALTLYRQNTMSISRRTAPTMHTGITHFGRDRGGAGTLVSGLSCVSTWITNFNYC